MTDAYSYIRFSTPDQQTGDSWRRQYAAIERFVSSHNLNLRESDAFHDLGVSSFRGANLRRGLGRFIAEVDSGKVKRGSYLIVESIDRLSRQGVFDSLMLLASLIEKGINVVTLDDGRPEILDKSAGLPTLLKTLLGMDLAHLESVKKSGRVSDAWEAKRAVAHLKPITSRCPEWLSLSKQEGRFIELPDRVATVRLAFELADAGLGRYRIVKYLNQKGHDSFRNQKNGWQPSSIAKLLRNRAVIGHYQPHRIVEDEESGRKKRLPVGPEITGYYPAIIDEDLFRRVSLRKEARVNPVRGRQGPALSNLFSGLLHCKWCDAPLTLQNKGKPPKGGRYLVCSRAQRGNGCRYRAWRYDEVETAILVKLREVDYAAVLGQAGASNELNATQNEVASTLEQIAALEKELAKFEASFADYDDTIPSGLIRKYGETEVRLESLKGLLDLLRVRERHVAAKVSDPKAFGDQLLALYEAMDMASEQDLYLLRMRLRERIGLLLKRIEIRAVAEDEKFDDGKGYHRTITLHFVGGQRRTIVRVGRDEFFSLTVAPSENDSEEA